MLYIWLKPQAYHRKRLKPDDYMKSNESPSHGLRRLGHEIGP